MARILEIKFEISMMNRLRKLVRNVNSMKEQISIINKNKNSRKK